LLERGNPDFASWDPSLALAFREPACQVGLFVCLDFFCHSVLFITHRYFAEHHTAIAFYFVNALENLSASTANEDFMDSVRKMTYAMMILGVIIFASMTLQATLIETAASEMTMALKTDWFKALLRQDIAYYDIMDVSGEATIISVNASKYRRGMGRKLALFVQFIITCIGGLAYAFWSSWQVSLAMLAVAPFMSLSTLFLLKVNTSQSARANASYAEAGSIVSTSVSSIRTILALNAVEIMLDRFKSATKRAFEGAVSELLLLGMANGANMAAMLLTYVIITLFGSWLLYDQVTDSGCDPSGTVEGNERCNPAGVDVFAALFGVSFAASVVPQISTSIESFAAAREACYPAFAVIHRSTAAIDDNESNKNREERAE
jgi:ATP-binding cassette subfamily B (MDR/TAP) protein 1